MGMIAGIFGLTFLASLAGEEFKFKEVLILSIILSIGSYLAFVCCSNCSSLCGPRSSPVKQKAHHGID